MVDFPLPGDEGVGIVHDVPYPENHVINHHEATIVTVDRE